LDKDQYHLKTQSNEIFSKNLVSFLPVSHRGLGLYICAGNSRLFFPTIPGGIVEANRIHKIFLIKFC
jgi:hypothetical protein